MPETNEEFLSRLANEDFLRQLGPGSQPSQHEARGMWDAIQAGYQMSATGLAVRGTLPTMNMAEDAPWYVRATGGAANMLTDLPLSIVGAAGGALVGSAVPGPGTIIGAGAGGFGLPMGIRDALVTAYGQDHARTWTDVWEIAKSAATGGAKGAAIGGLTMGAGRVVQGVVAPVVGAQVMRGTIGAGAARGITDASVAASELAAMTTFAAGIDGRLPTAQEFLDNAILLGGLKFATATAGRLRQVYAETGQTPAEIVAAAQADPRLLAEIVRSAETMDAAVNADPRVQLLLEQKAAPEVLARVRAEIVAEMKARNEFEIPSQYIAASIEQRVQAALNVDPRGERIREALAVASKPDANPSLKELAERPPALRMDYLYDDASMKAAERLIEENYKPDIEKQTRGVVAVKQTRAAAEQSSPLGDHVVGTAENARQVVVRGMMLREAAGEFARVRDELLAKPEAEISTMDKLRFAAANESLSRAHANYRGASAEAGRALQIMRQIKYDKSFLREAELLAKELDTSTRPFAELLKLSKALEDPEQAARFAREMQKSTTLEKLAEGWKASILSGPLTQLANIMGNAMKLGVEVPERAITATLTAARRAHVGDPMKMAEWKAQVLSPLIGWKLGTRDALVVAWEVFKGNEQQFSDKADLFKHAIPGTAGHVIRTPFRALQAADVIFRTPAERAQAYEMAVARAIKEGFVPETREYVERVTKYVNDPTLGLEAVQAEAAMATIQQAGAEAVFAQRLGPRMEMAQAAMRGTVLEFVVPFVRTPANLLSWAVQHTPVAPLLSERWRADFQAGGAKRDAAIARVVVGAGLTMLAYQLVQEGLLTGGGMFDPEQRRTKMAAGWQPYSIKIGDSYYSYQRIEPVAKVLGIVADFMEMSEKMDPEDAAKAFAGTMALFGNITISTTYLQGLAGTFNALTDPERYAEQWYEQYASSLVPKIISQPVQMLDPFKREVDGGAEAILSMMPYFRQRLMPARDVWGKERENAKALGILPINRSTITDDKVKQEAVRLALPIAPAPRFVYEQGPLDQKERRVELSAEQRDVMATITGQFALEILGPIVNDPTWKSIPDFAKAEVYRRVIEAARKKGRYEAMPGDAAEREKKRLEINAKIMEQVLKASE